MTASSIGIDDAVAVERGASMTEIYPRVLERVLNEGRAVAPRNRSTREVSPFMLVLDNPRESLVLQRARRINKAYAIVEKLALVAGIEDVDMFAFYIRRLRDYVNPCTGTFDGAYGPRVSRQLTYVYRTLKADPDSRRAVISIFTEGDQRESLDVPCTLSLQFLLRDGRLSLIVNMRSNDVYVGLPYDVNQFCFLQQMVASWLAVPLGSYIHFAGSAHLYEADVQSAEGVICAREDVSDFDEPTVNFTYEETLPELDGFFDVEERIRRGEVRDKTALAFFTGKPACYFWASQLVDFATKRAAVVE